MRQVRFLLSFICERYYFRLTFPTSRYLNGIETQTVAVFDDWAMLAEESARSLASFLDEVLVPHGRSGGCAGAISNPTAMVLTPLPVSHYHVCARTTLCEARCYDALAVFRAEMGRVASPHAAPGTYDLSAESPFFNAYATTTDAAVTAFAGEQQGAIAIATLPAINASANCRLRCGDMGRCVAVLLPSTRPQQPVATEAAIMGVRFYCVPDPAMLMSTVFPMALDAFDLSGVNTLIVQDGATLQHAELLWTPSQLLVLLYMARPTVAISLSNEATTTTTHEVHAWRPDGSGGAVHRRLLRGEDLAGSMLTPQVQRALFNGDTLLRPQVVGCSISSVLAVVFASNRLVLYLAFAAQIKGYATSVGTESGLTQVGHTLHAIITWETEDPLVEATASRTMRFFVPCPSDCSAFDVSKPTSCGGVCSSGLDAVIDLANHGTFASPDPSQPLQRAHMLYLPSSASISFPTAATAVDTSRALLLRLDPFAGVSAVLASFEMSDVTAVVRKHYSLSFTQASSCLFFVSRLEAHRVETCLD